MEVKLLTSPYSFREMERFAALAALTCHASTEYSSKHRADTPSFSYGEEARNLLSFLFFANIFLFFANILNF